MTRHADDQDYAEPLPWRERRVVLPDPRGKPQIIAESEGHKNRQDAVDVVAMHFPAAAYNLVDLTEQT